MGHGPWATAHTIEHGFQSISIAQSVKQKHAIEQFILFKMYSFLNNRQLYIFNLKKEATHVS